jgi:hypothetical protein
MVSFADWAATHRFLPALLFGVLLAAILLGVVAAGGSWWLWPLVALLAGPGLVVVFTPSESRPVADVTGAHLGHYR